ncbi:MAG: hypothetical protein SGBAC_011249 [Bacillariaceae sp.]
MVQISTTPAPASNRRCSQGGLCLAYLLIGSYIFYFFNDSDAMDGLGTSSSSSTTNNKAHKIGDSVATTTRDVILGLVNDPERINTSTELYDSNGNRIDPKKIVTDNKTYKFAESGHAHKLLDGMLGIEIGARSYQGFGLTSLNVDFLPSYAPNTAETTDEEQTKPVAVQGEQEDPAKKGNDNEIDRQLELAGVVRRVDVTLSPNDIDRLPFNDGALDFVLANRVLAPAIGGSTTQSDSDPFTWDPIICFCEWGRVVKDGGYIYAILPNKESTFWHREKKSTSIQEVIAAHMNHVKSPSDHMDDPILWNDHDATDFIWYMGLNAVDSLPQHDSVPGGFAMVIQVQRQNATEIIPQRGR